MKLKRSDSSPNPSYGLDKVKVDEVDIFIRGDARYVGFVDENPLLEQSEDDNDMHNTTNEKDDDDDDDDEIQLFPLPSPRSSPQASPTASQTNLAGTAGLVVGTCPRRASPLSSCCLERGVSDVQSNLPTEFLDTLTLHRTTSPERITSKPRRPSLSSIGGSLSKGSTVVLKGLADVAGSGAKLVAL